MQFVVLGAELVSVVVMCLQRGMPRIAALAECFSTRSLNFVSLSCCAVLFPPNNPGHFDILMGKRVEVEVFPLIHQFLLQHDGPKPRL